MKKLMIIQTLTLNLLISGFLTAHAADSAQSTKKYKSSKTSKWSVTTAVGASSSLTKSSQESSQDLSLQVLPSYKIGEKTKIISAISAEKALRDERKAKVNDAYIGLSFPIKKVNDLLNITGQTKVYASISDLSRKVRGRQTRLYAAPIFSFDLSTIELSRRYIPGLSFTYKPIYSKYVHKYNTGTNGKSNSAYSFDQLFSLDFAFYEKWSVNFTNVYYTNWTYQSNRRTSFEFDYSVSHEFNSNYSLGLGLNNSGSALGANGIDSNVKLFDARTTSLYTELGIKF
jgi:hypothetical protein